MLSEAEQQVLIAVLELGQGDTPPNQDNLEQRGREYFRRSLVDWSGAFERLCERGLITVTDGVYALTPDGEPQAAQLHAAHLPVYYFYRDYYTATQHSRAHADFCARVYGKDLCQHGYMDMAQLNKLLEVTNLSEDNRVLDLGCGSGLIAEYISDVTGAHVHGIDNNAEAIQQALERTAHKRDRLTFERGDIYHLDLPAGTFDTVIAVDTLYFGDNDSLIGQLKNVLKPGGQIAAYYLTIVWDENGDTSVIQPDKTDLGRVLALHDLPYRTWDFTQAEHARSQVSLQVAAELKADFEAEGNLFLYENRMIEGEGNIRFIETGRASRYLYHVVLESLCFQKRNNRS
jgi:SAM-dependent methyltransferase